MTPLSRPAHRSTPPVTSSRVVRREIGPNVASQYVPFHDYIPSILHPGQGIICQGSLYVGHVFPDRHRPALAVEPESPDL